LVYFSAKCIGNLCIKVAAMHQLLKHQLDQQRIDPNTVPLSWRNFLNVVNQVYLDAGLNGAPYASDRPANQTASISDFALRRKLVENERIHFKNLAESVPVGVLCTDADGNHEFSNHEWLKITGMTAEAIKGAGWRVAFHPEDRARLVELQQEALTTGQSFNLECRVHKLAGQEIWAYLTATMETKETELHGGMIFCLLDLTERKNTVKQIERTQRLHSIGVLAGGIAHDLNNALTPILMGLDMLRSRCPEQSRLLDGLQSSARHGAGVVKQLMAFAKGSEGERMPIQLRHLLQEVEKIISNTFPKNIRLQMNCSHKVSVVVGDATQLQQVIINLCVNARDAMPDGGVLTVELDSKEVDAMFAGTVAGARPGKFVVIKVRDTGLGIAPEIIDHIFDPFFTTKAPDKGTGLGLSTVVGIVKGHEGFIQVYSQPGKGATFAIYLPADRPSHDTKFLRKPGAQFSGNGETILFVDDEPIIREVVMEVLQRLGFKLVVAVDGADGLVKAMEHLPKLKAVISDMHMPHMDGLGLVHALRRIKPGLPAIIVSGRLDEAVKDQLNAFGQTGSLQKPFTESQLVETLKQVLAQNHQVS
jgi:PAS domain S-box-containing protein